MNKNYEFSKRCVHCNANYLYKIYIQENDSKKNINCHSCNKKILLNKEELKKIVSHFNDNKEKAKDEFISNYKKLEKQWIKKYKDELSEKDKKYKELNNEIEQFKLDLLNEEKNNRASTTDLIIKAEEKKINKLNKNKDLYQKTKLRVAHLSTKAGEEKINKLNKNKDLYQKTKKDLTNKIYNKKEHLQKIYKKIKQNNELITKNSENLNKINKYNIFKKFIIKRIENNINKLNKNLEIYQSDLSKVYNQIEKLKNELDSNENEYSLREQDIENNHTSEIENIKIKQKRFHTKYIKETTAEIKKRENEIRIIEEDKVKHRNLDAIKSKTESIMENLNEAERSLLEDQLNGLQPIEELSYEDSLKRLHQFRYLNEYGVWYNSNRSNKNFVFFQKSDSFWNRFTGKTRIRNHSESYFDGSRGIDDWASK